MMVTPEADTPPVSSSARWWRFVPITVIAIGAVAAWLMAGDFLTLDTIRENREALLGWREANMGIAIAAYLAVYIVAVAFSVPGAVWLTLSGGFIFGTVLSAGLTVVAATTGATLIFLAARSSLGAVLHERAGPWLRRVDEEVQQGEVSFMLVMRLIPVIPFFVANLAPAFVGVRLRTFVWTTLVGIAPATFVISSVGAGLGEVLDQGGEPDISVLFAPHVLGPLIGLAALAALPVVLRKLRGR
ncbi:MAG TPA: VTT domain-containing protein [Thermohalobaculum sp.]|nr:VTT domain-containing protein [Thermohalobaculum sp.]